MNAYPELTRTSVNGRVQLLDNRFGDSRTTREVIQEIKLLDNLPIGAVALFVMVRM